MDIKERIEKLKNRMGTIETTVRIKQGEIQQIQQELGRLNAEYLKLVGKIEILEELQKDE